MQADGAFWRKTIPATTQSGDGVKAQRHYALGGGG